MQRLENWVAPARPFVAVVERQLASLQTSGGGGGVDETGAGDSTREQMAPAVAAAAEGAVRAMLAVRSERDLLCSGCGQHAVPRPNH